MAISRRRLKNDPDRRVAKAVEFTKIWFPEKDVTALTRSNLDYWITELREGERQVRQFRKRLEALRDQSERACPECGRPVTGRPDAIYCEASCRIRAHRARRSAAS